MMKISGRVTWCCVALLLALTSVSAVQKTLKSINGLKRINFGKSVPMHSLLLLHWFANEINIDDNDIIQLTFDPNSGAYGSHHYGNYEDLLDPLPRGNQHRYYTIGNLHQGTSTQLPSYVVDPIIEDMGRNMDRIIFRVREQNIHGQAYQTIDQVFITQHIPHQGTLYDPAHTYRIDINLLREIREFAVGEDQQPLSYLRNRFGSSADDFEIENKWGELACLGLLLYIVMQEKHSSQQQNNRPENRRNPSNEREPRKVQNQGHVVLDFNDEEDGAASRRTGNGESDRWNNLRSCFACIILLGIIFFLLQDKIYNYLS
ncbi:uncharacterized protein [Pseudochaenichthys georgianus]|uniref:uncharacterized protein n=1 Tax=Pseudochaenichthys georgianus TaxID=52239 RepID=UPI00146E27B7|nr:uncharacterized protein LOC117451530 isoform X2 [Pseudochaenichthys georgianus]XP_033945770.1 uncharacterized protein LOC117451530 isoform X2 [Pseudochaenichthys georgianus]